MVGKFVLTDQLDSLKVFIRSSVQLEIGLQICAVRAKEALKMASKLMIFNRK